MFRTALLFSAVMILSTVPIQSAAAQTAPRTVVVKLVQRNGAMPFAFEPSTVQLRHGDTLEFVNAADVIHNVRFVHVAPGAKLGGAAVAPYMMKLGDSYTLVIDARFTDGSYAFVCDPHQMIGMKGNMVVSSTPAVASGK
jgi:plastocyanin